jgi:hypothetical protein
MAACRVKTLQKNIQSVRPGFTLCEIENFGSQVEVAKGW